MKKYLILFIFIVLFIPSAYSAVDFNGDADYIDFGDSGTSTCETTTWSMAIWANPEGTGDDILNEASSSSNNSTCRVNINTSSQCQCVFTNAAGTSTVVAGTTNCVTAGWVHIACVRNGGTLTTYVNGISEGTPGSPTGTALIDRGAIGRLNRLAPVNYYNGKATEAAIWTSALTADEIFTLAKSKVKGAPRFVSASTLKGYWPLDDHNGVDIAGDVYKEQVSGLTGTGTDANNNSINIPEELLTYQ